MHTHPALPRWQRLATFALFALALCSAPARADTLEGVLERGARYSVLWFASPESGDLIGQVFANTSQAGQVILASCLPGMSCVVKGTQSDVSIHAPDGTNLEEATPLPNEFYPPEGRGFEPELVFDEPEESMLQQLDFAGNPSGWWRILQAKSAYMQPGLHMSARALQTRFGPLDINDAHWLLFNGSPVLDSAAGAAQAATAAPLSAASLVIDPAETTAAATAQPSLLARLQNWWNAVWQPLRNQLLAWLGRAPANSTGRAQAQAQAPHMPTATQAVPPADPASAPLHNGTAQVVQGNVVLHLVAHFELPDRDIVLLQSTGGTACPALYRFATLTQQGIAVTPEFGTCSDIASIVLPDPQPGNDPEPVLSIVGFKGPSNPEAEQQQAARSLYRFALRQGKVLEMQSEPEPEKTQAQSRSL